MLQTIRRCYNFHEASRVRLCLDSIGIESFLPDEMMSQIEPPILMNTGVRVQVREEDVPRALEALADFDQAAAAQE